MLLKCFSLALKENTLGNSNLGKLWRSHHRSTGKNWLSYVIPNVTMAFLYVDPSIATCLDRFCAIVWLDTSAYFKVCLININQHWWWYLILLNNIDNLVVQNKSSFIFLHVLVFQVLKLFLLVSQNPSFEIGFLSTTNFQGPELSDAQGHC